MAQSTLALLRVDLQKSVALLLGAGLDSTAWDAEERQQIDHCIDVGARRAYGPVVLPGERNAHEWSFLQPLMTGFQLHGAYTTGTVVVALGIVTLTGGTWPTWAASAQLVIDGVAYDVNTRDSNTQLTLNDLTVTEASTEYSLQETTLTLPDNYGAFDGDLYFEHQADGRAWAARLKRVDIGVILQQRQISRYTSRPVLFAVHAIPPTGTAFQNSYLTVYPAPDGDYVLTGTMRLNPDKLTSSATFPNGGYLFAELLRTSCLAAVETEIFGEAGLHSQQYVQQLQAAVSQDRMASNPGVLGYNGNRIHWPSKHMGRSWMSERADRARFFDSSTVEYA